jgi:hypothetical protein
MVMESGRSPKTALDSPAAASTSPAPGSDICNPAYAPKGDNIVNPALRAIDTSDLAIVGHSMGALSLLN